MHKKEETSLADQVMSEVSSKYDPNLVDQSNQSFKASQEFAKQIAPIIHTPKQVVSFWCYNMVSNTNPNINIFQYHFHVL